MCTQLITKKNLTIITLGTNYYDKQREGCKQQGVFSLFPTIKMLSRNAIPSNTRRIKYFTSFKVEQVPRQRSFKKQSKLKRVITDLDNTDGQLLESNSLENKSDANFLQNNDSNLLKGLEISMQNSLLKQSSEMYLNMAQGQYKNRRSLFM